MKALISAAAFAAAIILAASSGKADTIHLKNGSWIDGTVTLKTDTFIELQIGKIGKIELPVEEIHLIEKNNRTGEEYNKTYVEAKGKVETPGKASAEGNKDKKPAKEKGGSSEPAKESGPPSTGSGKPEADPAGEPEPEDPVETAQEGPPPPLGADLDPALVERIRELVDELQRERSRNRIQAERHLEAIGQPAIPFLLPIAKSESDLTRIAVMRLFNAVGDSTVVESAIAGLLDENEYVREYANKALKRITGEDFGFLPSASPRRREAAQEKWAGWWAKEKKTLAEERKLSEKR